MRPGLTWFVFLLVLLSLAACGGGNGGGASTTPEAPTNVTATPGPGYITVAWQDNSDSETGFVIYREEIATTTTTTHSLDKLVPLSVPSTGVQPQKLTSIAEVEAGVTSYQDNEVTSGHSYRYAVAAKGAGGTSPPADQSDDVVTPDPKEEAPGFVAYLGTANLGDGELETLFSFRFDFENPDSEEEFTITISGPEAWGTYSYTHSPRDAFGLGFISRTPITGTYIIEGTFEGVDYRYEVALDASQVLQRATGLTLESSSTDRIAASWSEVPGADDYHVRLWETGGSLLSVAAADTNSFDEDYFDLDPAKQYELQIAALSRVVPGDSTSPAQQPSYSLSERFCFTPGDTAFSSCGGETPQPDAPSLTFFVGTENSDGEVSGFVETSWRYLDQSQTFTVTIRGPDGSIYEEHSYDGTGFIGRGTFGKPLPEPGTYTAEATIDGVAFDLTIDSVDPTQVLDLPGNITLQATRTDLVEVSWDPVPNATWYQVNIWEVETHAQAAFLYFEDASASSARFEVEDLNGGLDPNKEYFIEVQARSLSNTDAGSPPQQYSRAVATGPTFTPTAP